MTAQAIQDEALRLDPNDRAKLIDVLWESLSDAAIKARESAWLAEAESRLAAVESGQMQLHDADSVFQDLRTNLER